MRYKQPGMEREKGVERMKLEDRLLREMELERWKNNNEGLVLYIMGDEGQLTGLCWKRHDQLSL